KQRTQHRAQRIRAVQNTDRAPKIRLAQSWILDYHRQGQTHYRRRHKQDQERHDEPQSKQSWLIIPKRLPRGRHPLAKHWKTKNNRAPKTRENHSETRKKTRGPPRGILRGRGGRFS